MNNGVGARLLAWFLVRFYRLFFAAAAGLFGILWVFLSLTKALLVLALVVLGYLIGKWVDEGRPDGGLSSRLRRMLEEED